MNDLYTHPSAADQTLLEDLELLRRGLGLSMAELWWRYFALGGMLTSPELDAVLTRALVPTKNDCDLLTVALYERAQELGGVSQRTVFCSELAA